MYIDTLSSVKNPRIKELVTLQERSRERRESGLFVVEGIRELEACIKGGFVIETLFFQPEIFPLDRAKDTGSQQLNEVTADLYSKIAYRDSTEGVIAIVRDKQTSLDGFTLSANPLILVLEAVEKPGNLGAVLRTADAARADAVIVCNPLTDLFNPNLIRSSLGTIFTTQVAACTSEECCKWLKKNQVKIFTAELQASEWYHKTDFRGASAIVMGSEAEGLSQYWRENADGRIKIPMNGFVDSLNVSVSTAIICFEALRQRDFKF